MALKLSTITMILLVVVLCFSLTASMINDMSQSNPSSSTNISSWEESYNYTNRINSSFTTTKRALEIIGEEEEAWFIRVASGLAAIPVAVVEMVGALFLITEIGILMLITINRDMGIPPIVTTIAIIALFITLILQLISFLHRKDV